MGFGSTNVPGVSGPEFEKHSSDMDLSVRLLLNAARQNAWEIERGSVSLTNNAIYPANSSTQTVALSTARESGKYVVLTEVVSATGNVGEVEISDKLTNGFKIGYNGSATAAVINYTVIGGFLK